MLGFPHTPSQRLGGRLSSVPDRHAPALKNGRSRAQGLSYVPSSNPAFISPDRDVVSGIVPEKTAVVLISSPAAAGKSTFAAELASRTGATLWDLSRIHVGSRTFAGTIMEAYDFEATGVVKRLRSGEFLFILDALDEAQVRAGSQNFEAFIGDLAKELKSPKSKPTLVLLARNDTADWVQLLLEDAGVSCGRGELVFFDLRRAELFISKWLDSRCDRDQKPPIHRQQPRPFADARSGLFDLIYSLLGVQANGAWSDSRVQSFLGYAPVLEALAEYLYVGNYMSLVGELRSGVSAIDDPWRFLAQIVARLLEREKKKVQLLVRDNLEVVADEVHWSAWESLYGAAEQCTRILSHVMNAPTSPAFEGMPKRLSDRYEDVLKTILPQHPFLAGHRFANVVFREYSYAWGLTQGSETLARSLRAVIRDRDAPFLPSKLFSHFVVQISGGPRVVLDGQDLGVFYESILLRSREAALSLWQAGGATSGSIDLEQEDSEIEVDILDTGAGIHFWRRLRNAEIDVTGTVQLGSPGQRILLGPAVDVSCARLILGSEDVEVDAGDDVRLRAEGFAAAAFPTRLRVRNEASGRLGVTWPDVAHPWAPYRARESGVSEELSASLRGDALRKLVLMFRRQRTRKEETLRSARWAPEQSGERDELIALAFQHGVLTRDAGRPVVKFNTKYDSLKTLVGGGEPALSPEARRFVADYLGADLANRVLKPTRD